MLQFVRNKKVTQNLLVMLLNIIIEVCNNYELRPGNMQTIWNYTNKYEKYDCETWNKKTVLRK